MKNLQKVSDEEFDKLFQDKLYAYEAEPTDAVWAGISNQLPGPKKARSFPILRIAAASMAGMIGLGVWLAETKEPMKLSRDTGQSLETVTVKVAKVNPATKPVEDSYELVESTVKEELRFVPQEISVKKELSAKSKSSRSATKAEDKMIASNIQEAKEQTANLALPTADSKVTTAVALSANPTIDTAANEMNYSRKRIRSIGSLVNYVVGKVDKRKVKIIEFEDGDEGTKVSGLNLGFMKIKSKEKYEN